MISQLRFALSALALFSSSVACDSPKSVVTTSQNKVAPRVVVMSPSAAEAVVALGLEARVVAVGDAVLWPPAVAALPKVGGYDSPNPERVLSLGATMVFAVASQAGQKGYAQLATLGVRVVGLDSSTYEGALGAIEQIGAELSHAEQARHLVREIRDEIASVRQRAERLQRPRVLLVVGREPLYVACAGSHLDKLVGIAGGDNVTRDFGHAYQLASLEAVLQKRPEVIIDLTAGHKPSFLGRTLGTWARWDFLPAVRNGHVYFVHPDRLSIPGPRLPQMASLMLHMLHPEHFGEASEAQLGPLASNGG